MPNRKFGTVNKFGTTNTFGASTAADVGRKLSFGLMVDWDDDGLFDGSNEATHRMERYDIVRGREFFLDSEGSGFEPMSTGRLTVVLKDTAGRYNPYNTSSPLFGLLSKKQKIKLIVYDEVNGQVYSRFTGYIEDIKYKFGTVPRATITALDGISKLKKNPIRSTSVQTSIQYDQAIINNLGLAGWNDGTNIDITASDTMPYYWTRGRTAFSEISELVNATRGHFFVDADGVAVYLSALSSESPVVSIDESHINYEYGVRVPSPREVVRNKVRIYARSRQEQADVEIWRGVDKPAISVGAPVTMWADFSYNEEEAPATAVTTPVATTDYTVFANVDGTGTDYTGNVTVTMTQFASTAKLVFTISSGSGFITLAKLRGTVISVDKYTFAEDEDTDSQAIYGIREMVIKSDWLQDVNSATDQAFVLVTQLSNPKQFPRVLLRNQPAKQFAVELMDVVTVDFPTFDISDDLRVGYINESWSKSSPNTVDTIIYFEPNLSGAASGAWIFTAIFGATTVFA